MNRWHFFALVMALCVMMLAPIGMAQDPPPSSSSQPYEPVVPAPSMGSRIDFG